VEEAAAAAGALQEQAANLSRVVSVFKLTHAHAAPVSQHKPSKAVARQVSKSAATGAIRKAPQKVVAREKEAVKAADDWEEF